MSSPLFELNVADIFGQMSDPHAVPMLLKVLEDEREEEMVRHEAAEVLGGIATDEVLPALRKWAAKDDAPRVVRESCAVAIDMWEVCYSSNLQLGAYSPVYHYENSNQFQDSNGLDMAGLLRHSPWSSVITPLSQNLCVLSSPQIPYQIRATRVSCYYSAKQTAKSKARRDRGIYDCLSCLRYGVADTITLVRCSMWLREG